MKSDYKQLLTPMDWQIEALRYAADKAGDNDEAYRRAMVEARRYQLFWDYMQEMQEEVRTLKGRIRDLLEGEKE